MDLYLVIRKVWLLWGAISPGSLYSSLYTFAVADDDDVVDEEVDEWLILVEVQLFPWIWFFSIPTLAAVIDYVVLFVNDVVATYWKV